MKNGFDDMIEACKIFKKYKDCKFPFNCNHDELYVAVDPELVSNEDKKQLEELGFSDHAEYGVYGFIQHM